MVELRTHIPRRVQHFGFVTKNVISRSKVFQKFNFQLFSSIFPVPVMPGADAQQVAHHVALLFAPDLLHVLVGTHRSERKQSCPESFTNRQISSILQESRFSTENVELGKK